MNYMIGLKTKLDNTNNKTVVLQERPISNTSRYLHYIDTFRYNGVDGHNPFIRMSHSVLLLYLKENRI